MNNTRALAEPLVSYVPLSFFFKMGVDVEYLLFKILGMRNASEFRADFFFYFEYKYRFYQMNTFASKTQNPTSIKI